MPWLKTLADQIAAIRPPCRQRPRPRVPSSRSPTRPGAPTRPTSSRSWTARLRHCNHRQHRPDRPARPTAWIYRPFRRTVTPDGWGIHGADRPTMREAPHRRIPIAVGRFGRFGRSCRHFGWGFLLTRVKHWVSAPFGICQGCAHGRPVGGDRAGGQRSRSAESGRDLGPAPRSNAPALTYRDRGPKDGRGSAHAS